MKHKSKHLRIVIFTTCILLLPGIRLLAQWSTNAALNNAVSTAAGRQDVPVITTDGADGAIIAFWDDRNGNWDIYAQRMTATGTPKWTAGGVPICVQSGGQTNVRIVSDGAGGAIMAWIDTRGGNDNNIYAQRIDALGNGLWTTNGVAICTASFSELNVRVTADGAGGAIISWRDRRNGPTKGPTNIYVQRINSAGIVLWATNGVPICTQATIEDTPDLTSDGQKGAYIAWDDMRGADQDIYIQHVDSSGTVSWTTDGIALCATSGMQRYPKLIPDGSGGAIIIWEDSRNGDIDLYAQQVNSAGTTSWTGNGIVVCNATLDQQQVRIIPDNAGGAILTWYDGRVDPYFDIYAQYINSSGTSLWTANGEAVCTESSEQMYPCIAPSGTGAIISWWDGRNGYLDIYAQRLDAAGISQWTTDGIAISTATYEQFSPEIVASTCGGAIITWYDLRDVPTDDGQIYAQRINTDGNIGPSLALVTQIHVICNNPGAASIDITASYGVSPYTYAWTGTGVNPTSEDQSGLSAGTYTVLVTDTLGCTVVDTMEVFDCAPLIRYNAIKEEEIQIGFNVSVQPNPINNFFTIRVKSSDLVNPVSIRIFNTEGRAVISTQKIAIDGVIRINADTWMPGIYYAEVVQADKKEVIKLVKMN
jgi:hypothetical protein